MIQHGRQRRNQRFLSALMGTIVALCSLTFAGCFGNSSAKVIHGVMGEKVIVEGASYNVLGADWVDSLGEGATARIPTHDFLLLRIAATNESAAPVDMALLKLIGEDGTEYGELGNGVNVREWLGLARSLDPKESRQGVVLFDAPKAVYKLQVADAFYDGESGTAALIHIPIRPTGPEPAVSGAIP